MVDSAFVTQKVSGEPALARSMPSAWHGSPATNPVSLPLRDRRFVRSGVHLRAARSVRRSTPQTTTVAAGIRLPPLAAVAHDLRGPLQALALSAEALLDSVGGPNGPDQPQIERLAATVQRQVLWLQGLVENVHAATIMQA